MPTLHGVTVQSKYLESEQESATKYSQMTGSKEFTPNLKSDTSPGFWEAPRDEDGVPDPRPVDPDQEEKIPGVVIENEYYDDEYKPLQHGIIPEEADEYDKDHPKRRYKTSPSNPSGSRYAINHPLGRFEINKTGDVTVKSHGDTFNSVGGNGIEHVGGDKITKVNGNWIVSGTIIFTGNVIIQGTLLVEGDVLAAGGTMGSKIDDPSNPGGSLSSENWVSLSEHLHEQLPDSGGDSQQDTDKPVPEADPPKL